MGKSAPTGQTWEAVRARIQAGDCDDPATEYALAWLNPAERAKLDKGMATTQAVVEQLRREYLLVVAPVLGLPTLESVGVSDGWLSAD